MKNKLNHIALILDGNKRWSKQNKVSNLIGYTKGFENIKNLIKYSLTLNLSNLTLFALSSENYNRTSINLIYDIIYENFSNILDELVNEKGVKVKIFGNKNNLPQKILNIFEEIENLSKVNNTLNLNIAFNYGFKYEIHNIIKNLQNNKLKINDDSDIDNLFFLGSLPDPDILIRTGGYQRLSNFIMYKLTYTELFFTKTLWPDFSKQEYLSIINQFLNINRKYGL